jgi:hypothetical protein
MEQKENLSQIGNEEIIRADGRCICQICGKKYIKHNFSYHLDSNREPYLNVLCDGTLVKL